MKSKSETGNINKLNAINNFQKEHQKNIERKNVLNNALTGAGIGAVVNGIQSFTEQKNILNRGTEYLDELTLKAAKETTSQTEYLKIYTQVIEPVKDIIKHGKVNFSLVGKAALTGAVIFGSVFAAAEIISNTFKNIKSKNKQAN